MPNRLAAEQSPYLLQHKDNPVDWYPWADEAFARARREDKPIFLSIGYSTCHWCHVMAHESFENAQVAEVLNRDFVAIKLDREERPDVDRVYMTFVQATTGSGGWPMSVWLTPALEPFYGGTYYPPTSRWGRPGFVEILTEIARVWREERPNVIESASRIVGQLRNLGASDARSGSIPGTDVLAGTAREFAAAFDRERGGFGTQPKFPRPSELLFLLRQYWGRRSFKEDTFPGADQSDPLHMVLTTLRAMGQGGMRDHVGGGFHRYAVDRDWRVPHFEKMLYDQAQLVLAYVEAAQASGDRYFADVALDTLDYVRRDMTDRSGGFYSAEDADSIPPEHAGEPHAHKMEGAFYIWRDQEIGDALGPDADVFRARYGILPDGNAPFDPQNEFAHKNLLHQARSIEEVARLSGRSIEDVTTTLDRSRLTLRGIRERRPRPHLDDKILTAWNGLMIGAFARAGRMVAGADRCIADAQRAARFIRSHLWDRTTGTLSRRYRDDEAGIDAYAEDYAFLIFGLLELLQADGDPAWLEWAIDLQRRQDELFWDEREGGWFSTTGADPTVLLRMKEEYDGAEPAATSVSLLNLLVMTHLTGDETLTRRLESTLGGFASRVARAGRAVPLLLSALSTYHAGMPQLVVTGDAVAREQLLDTIRRHYLPTAIVLPIVPSHRDRLAAVLPWTAAMSAAEAAVYICRDFTCEQPITSADELDAALRSMNQESGIRNRESGIRNRNRQSDLLDWRRD
jgi:uncharacterized protein YyaL (SSP411 family)